MRSEEELGALRMTKLGELGAEILDLGPRCVRDVLVLHPVNRADGVRDASTCAHAFERRAKQRDLELREAAAPASADQAAS